MLRSSYLSHAATLRERACSPKKTFSPTLKHYFSSIIPSSQFRNTHQNVDF
ncbi:hypothetical protein [Rubritalea tangerina]|uniref:hypothetical protein n=1 Tax=Rubritalea tangerina TaxID=430798 RepID=UPI00361AEECD